MKQIFITLLFLILFIPGFLNNPVFVSASSTCYVDEDDGDEDGDGDGDKDDPFEDINDALDDGCEKIIVKDGSYSDDITISRNTTIEGESEDGVVISGEVTMKDGSELKNVTVSGEGITVSDGADVDINNATIKNASTGIETSGDGKLTVKDTLIYGNGKGMYIQEGKDVDITDSEVRDNDEEGIDIRANVDGEISDNSITNNGESGIEVILGKSELVIFNNSIKKNDASGIALQYYKESSKIGAVKIKSNTITKNDDYGVNCKAPSGGNPGVDYWSESTNMSSNKVYSNDSGNFSDSCFFSDETVSDATKTKEQKEAEAQKAKAAAAALAAQAEQQESVTQDQQMTQAELKAKAQEEENEKKEKEQEELRTKLQKEKNLQSEINESFVEMEELGRVNAISWRKIEKRPAFITFIIGPNYTEIENIESTLSIYEEKIINAKDSQDQITDEDISMRVGTQIEEMESDRDNLQLFVDSQKEEFSLLGWIFNHEKKE